jgi:hypothetical protein
MNSADACSSTAGLLTRFGSNGEDGVREEEDVWLPAPYQLAASLRRSDGWEQYN